MKHYLRLFYEAAAGDGGAGGGLPPSLADIEGGDGTQKPVNLDAAAQAAADQAAQAAAAAEAEYQALVKEAKNEDGSLKPGYKEENGKVVKDPDYNPNAAAAGAEGDGDDGDGNGAGEGDDDPLAFWTDVNKLHGREFQIEYPEGVDPISPEGAYHREKVIMQQAVNDFESYLQKADPRAYAYMLHRQAGGSDDDFFSEKTVSLPEYNTFKESTDVQVSVYKSSLIQKGLDAESAQLLVDKAIKDGKLFDQADVAYKAIEKSHAQQLADIEAANQRAQETYTSSVNKLNQSLTVAVSEGKGLNIAIPDTEKPGFLEFVREKVEYDSRTGKFLLVQPIADEELNRQLESLYLLYKKGDLKSLIQREAQTQNVRRLKKVVDKSKQGQNSGGQAAPAGRQPGSFVALGDL